MGRESEARVEYQADMGILGGRASIPRFRMTNAARPDLVGGAWGRGARVVAVLLELVDGRGRLYVKYPRVGRRMVNAREMSTMFDVWDV